MQILFDILRGNYYRKANQVESTLSLVQKPDKKSVPKILWIGCSDIYLAPHTVLGLDPEDLIMHHNIANQIKKEDASVQSVIQYAIESLGVKKIIICGHHHCNSINATLEAAENVISLETPINQWMQDVRELVFQHWLKLQTISSRKERSNRLAELNVLKQVAKLKQNECVKKHAHQLQIMAWMFDTEKGMFIDLASQKIINAIVFTK